MSQDKDDDKTFFGNEILVISIPHKIFVYAPKTEKLGFKFVKEPKGPIVVFIPGICMMRGITDYDKA